MGFFDRFRQTAQAAKTLVTQSPALFARMASGGEYNMPSLYTARNQADLYTKLTWVAIAINTVAETAAPTEFNVFAKDGEGEEGVEAHPFEVLLGKPNPLESRFEYLSNQISFLKLTGNAYTWLNTPSQTGAPVEMWTIPSYMIEPIPDGKLYVKGYAYNPGDGGEPIIIPPQMIMHLKRTNPNSSFVGLSQISQISTVAVGDLAMQQHNTQYFQGEGGKIPGFFAFADMVEQTEWDKIRDEIERRAKARELMLIRGAGKGGVEWVQNGLTQAEMQFIEGRNMNKEEIFTWLAPGLNSWLAVNSTEANSKSGRAAFYELSVYPILTAFAEKITNDLLPLYGKNLVGRFEDVRQSDRNLKLEEQKAYERTHTIEEVRAKQYGDAPLGDERDKMTVLELAKGAASQNGTEIPSIETFEAPGGDLKAKEREQFNRYARKRVTEGKAEKLDEFRFKYLEAVEQDELMSLWGGVGRKSPLIFDPQITEIRDALLSLIDQQRGKK